MSRVSVELDLGTFATLIAGMYCTYSAVNPMAIPEYLWLEVATKVAPYLKDVESFEDWIKYNLLIIPKDLCSEEDIESYKKNTEYFERENGNAILIVTFEV